MSGWISAHIFGGDVATDEEVKAAIEIIVGEVRMLRKKVDTNLVYGYCSRSA